MANMVHLDRVVSDLERDQNLRRIKKLLYCSCYGVWEDAPAKLEQVALRDILQGVWERSPTLDALQFQLNRIVKTLNKPVEYAHVANTILRAMTPLYRTAYDITRPLNRSASNAAPATQWLTAKPDSPAPLDPQQLEAEVVRSLSEHEDNVRLKKLLVCVCKNLWENDLNQLQARDWAELLRETQELVPNLENLDYVLQAIVKSLSKPLDYLPIASTLLQSLRPLYEQRPKPTDTLFYGIDNSPVHHPIQEPEPTEFYAAPVAALPTLQPPSIPAPSIANPGEHGDLTAPLQGWGQATEPATGQASLPNQSLPNQPLSEQSRVNQSLPSDEIPTGLMAPLPAPAEDSTTADVELLNALQHSLAEDAEAPGLPADAKAPLESLEAGTHQPGGLAPTAQTAAASTAALATQAQPQDDFSLRLDIMRYANPLMVKIVAFSAIHRLFRFSEQDWAELHHHSLNGLLTTLRHNYPNFTDLETKLCLTAEQIELQDNAMKTVAAMLKVLKPFYSDAVAERQLSLSPTPVHSLEDDLDLLAAALEDDSEADENSCQVF